MKAIGAREEELGISMGSSHGHCNELRLQGVDLRCSLSDDIQVYAHADHCIVAIGVLSSVCSCGFFGGQASLRDSGCVSIQVDACVLAASSGPPPTASNVA